MQVNKLCVASQRVASLSHCELWKNKAANCELINQQGIKLKVCEAASWGNWISISVLKNKSFFFLNFIFYSSAYLHDRAQYFSCFCHVSEVKKILKSTCGREEVKQLGNVSIGFGCHAVGQKVIAVNLRYFSAYNTGILSYKTDKWFPLCDIIHKFKSSCYDWLLYHIFWEHSGFYFVIFLAYIFSNFWKIDSVYIKECFINISIWKHNRSRPEVLYNNSCSKNFGHFLGNRRGWN